MSVLVTGGAGYIGAHVVDLLDFAGISTVVIDDFSVGKPERVPNSTVHKMNISDNGEDQSLAKIMSKEAVDTVIHFAARKQVGESVERPLYYYKENVDGMRNVLSAMQIAGVKKLVFSSSAATYGQPNVKTVNEDSVMKPINPYGETKLICEWMARATCKVNDMRFVGLRYFNAAGSGKNTLGDPAILNLVPMVFDKLEKGENPAIFGNNYDTPDGTCVRDYIHVTDLAQAHIDAITYLEQSFTTGIQNFDVFNVSTGKGTSVKEIIDAVARATGINFKTDIMERRAGDPAYLVGSNKRIRTEFNWKASFGIDDIVSSAWTAWRYDHA